MNFSDDDEDYREFFNIEEYDGAFEQYYEMTVIKYSNVYELPPYKVYLIVTIIHSCICAVGYVGNIITCIVIASNKSMHTTTNIYLFNLAIADLMMLTSGLVNFTIANWYPFKVIEFFILYFYIASTIFVLHRLYGMKGCFVFTSISDTAVNVSIMTITAFTIERYLAICHPFLARTISSISKAVKVIFVIWTIGIIFGYLIGSQQKMEFMMNESMCIYVNNIPYIVEIESVIFFVLPFTLITVSYILIGKKLLDSTKIQKNQRSSNPANGHSEIRNDDGSNRQILKMLVIVVAVFFVCWAPFHIRRLFGLRVKEWMPNTFIGDMINIEFVLTNIFCVTYFLSSAINPVIYSAMSNKFRDAFKNLIKCRNICRKEQTAQTQKSTITTATAV